MQAHIYPEPHVILPNLPHIHTNTLILLHGTSTSGPELAAPLLSTNFIGPSSQTPATIHQFFPTCKFVFPTGSLNPTTVFNSRHTHAWFDVHSFADRTIGEDSASFRHGLRASLRYLAALIKAEVEILRKQKTGGRVVMGGFSQGAAMVITLLLSGELEMAGIGSEFGGVVGMSGWLPLRSQIDEVSKDISYDVPIFLGHGQADEKVRLELGLQAMRVLRALGFDVQWEGYNGLSHWWNAEEIANIAKFMETVWSRDAGSRVA
ncbi:hypothetical protein OIDMADRAFT_129925 [Oidiodendron maius Zn]|uniref:Phospholipase/carboxylesterase/thioesterase domain-containing protein n=1 Tax=Oidiodendron maius (strain Zn) TaxID=913774 RepID=A0A0C3H349_OIDMZ|nr:hypothetical protein OIDMADRAFT_129925 [Oidiodendron maius Zn]